MIKRFFFPFFLFCSSLREKNRNCLLLWRTIKQSAISLEWEIDSRRGCKQEYLDGQKVNLPAPNSSIKAVFISNDWLQMLSESFIYCTVQQAPLPPWKKGTLLLFISMQMRGKCIPLLQRRGLISIHILICIFPHDLSSSSPSHSLFYHRGVTVNSLIPHFIVFKK